MAATTQVQILVWTQGYGSSCRHSHVRCALVCVTILHDLLAISRDIAARHVTVIEDNMDRRRSPDDPGILVPLRIFREDFDSRSTSSSGQDVALWPRQPRLKSWCVQFAKVAMLPLPCQLLHAACPLALGPCPPRVHHAWHRGVVPRRRQHRQATAQRMAGAGCARQAPLPVNHASG